MVHGSTKKDIDTQRHLGEIILEQDVIAAVEADVDLRVSDPADICFLFLVQSPADVHHHALPFNGLVVSRLPDHDVSGKGPSLRPAVEIQGSGQRGRQPFGIADRHVVHRRLDREILGGDPGKLHPARSRQRAASHFTGQGFGHNPALGKNDVPLQRGEALGYIRDLDLAVPDAQFTGNGGVAPLIGDRQLHLGRARGAFDLREKHPEERKVRGALDGEVDIVRKVCCSRYAEPGGGTGEIERLDRHPALVDGDCWLRFADNAVFAYDHGDAGKNCLARY